MMFTCTVNAKPLTRFGPCTTSEESKWKTQWLRNRHAEKETARENKRTTQRYPQQQQQQLRYRHAQRQLPSLIHRSSAYRANSATESTNTLSLHQRPDSSTSKLTPTVPPTLHSVPNNKHPSTRSNKPRANSARRLSV
ncbi:hypothetical protein DM02DRAFT_227858 [Periconia macrospinosa]|uniref:Uncharacterized protein n=1 Tax=Periconia macrospinosa TaxID=97972 RepID=A0A2V1D5T0_9PLEO|nr:hypothetical protein DM02DRAFT_227858 [Periconia macrospinosa]